MRLSVDRSDPGWLPDASTGWIVLFNGVPQGRSTQRAIVTADEALAFITFERLDDTGNLEIECIDGEYYVKQFTETGQVFIMRNPCAPSKPSPDPDPDPCTFPVVP